MHLVDGGYVSWTYGVDARKASAWDTAKWAFSKNNGAIFLMDSSSSYREDFYPDYKSRRRNQYIDHPERLERKERVDRFKEMIRADPTLAIAEVEGLEADDLIALYSLMYPFQDITVTGIDKDLLQLRPRIRLFKTDQEEVTIKTFANRMQKTLAPHIHTPHDVLLSIAIMGDHSDSIPRLVPPRQLELFIDVLHHPDPWGRAIQLFGYDEVARNCYLTVLPWPGTYLAKPTPAEVLDWLRQDHYTYVIAPAIELYLRKIMKEVTDHVRRKASETRGNPRGSEEQHRARSGGKEEADAKDQAKDQEAEAWGEW